jgi:hypothetical protein
MTKARKWSEEDNIALEHLMEKGMLIEELSTVPHRSKEDLRARMKLLGHKVKE